MIHVDPSQTLLTDVLRLLTDGGIHSTAELARRLGVSEGLLTVMMDDLGRRGYLAPVDSGCGGGCSGCASRSACGMPDSTATAPHLFTLTERGVRAAQRG